MPPSSDTDRIRVNLTHEKTVFSPQCKRRAAEERFNSLFFESKDSRLFLRLKTIITSVFLRSSINLCLWICLGWRLLLFHSRPKQLWIWEGKSKRGIEILKQFSRTPIAKRKSKKATNWRAEGRQPGTGVSRGSVNAASSYVQALPPLLGKSSRSSQGEILGFFLYEPKNRGWI